MPRYRYSDAAIATTIRKAADPQAPLLACGKAAYLNLSNDEQAVINRGLRHLSARLPLVGTVTSLEILTAIAVKIAQIEDMDNAND